MSGAIQALTVPGVSAEVDRVRQQQQLARDHVDKMVEQFGRHSTRGCPPGTRAMCEHADTLESAVDLTELEKDLLNGLHDDGADEVLASTVRDCTDWRHELDVHAALADLARDGWLLVRWAGSGGTRCVPAQLDLLGGEAA